MKKLPKVLVIMSTYNGEKFLKEQIDSILAQKDIDVYLHIFDDLSKDSTVEIAKEYEKKNKNVKVHINEKNKNFTYNFLDALFSFKDNQEYDYYAFADQDDFWLDTKLISAINKIKEVGKCTLYSANLKIVDQNLEYAGNNMMDTKYVNKHYDIICKNIVTGCTAVFDNDFKNLVTKHYPENIYLHDYWLALIANYTKDAHFVYDTCPDYILYRQHGTNLIGENKSYIKKAFKKKQKEKTTKHLIEVFVDLFGDVIKNEDALVFKKLSNLNKFKNKFVLFFKIKSNYSKIFKIKLLLNKY
ncbi:MAG: glycosyltransferase [Clostridia bacterium]|nr:glycosyltransferase [Clostridia bacterium]